MNLSRFSLRPGCVAVAFLLACGLALPGCGHQQGDTGGDGTASNGAGLPGPESGGGSVTGMPDKPGPGPVGPPSMADATLLPDTATAEDGEMAFPVAGDAQADAGAPAATSAGQPAPAAEPSVEDAVAVVRAYYAAIDARQYPRAWSLWSGGGSASGQSPEQFAAGFGDTANVVVEPGTPGRLDAAAGSRYVEVPVSVRATRADGSAHRYVGSYTLRRAVVDGASAEQHAWRIASADIREVR